VVLPSNMSGAARPRSLFRSRAEHEHHRVTSVELFFDLVFVFAVTQLSHKLLEDFSANGALETGVLLFAVWWVWVYTSWITNWLDPDRAPVRLMLLALMFAGLGLSTSIPKAFGTRGLVFASAYMAMQFGRTVFMQWAIAKDDVVLRRNFARVAVWVAVPALLWIGGALRGGRSQLALWAGAVALEYTGPAARFWTPGLGASNVSDWAIEGGHLAERCGLFIIIALGESVLVTGATFANASWTPTTFAAFALAFTSSVAMWWIYFDRGAEAGVEKITRAADPGRLGRLAYTYFHLPIVAGIILSAVADERVLARPGAPVEARSVIGALGGPFGYLLGTILFRRAVRGRFQLSHLVGAAALLATALFAAWLSPLTIAGAATIVLVGVAAWEAVSLRRERRE
jgi:low temperature requirement protein LtrA